MRKMNHEVYYLAMMRCKRPKKKPRSYPRRGKTHLGADQKNPRICPRPRVPVFCNIARFSYFGTWQKKLAECYVMENGSGGTRKNGDYQDGDENGARATRGR